MKTYDLKLEGSGTGMAIALDDNYQNPILPNGKHQISLVGYCDKGPWLSMIDSLDTVTNHETISAQHYSPDEWVDMIAVMTVIFGHYCLYNGIENPGLLIEEKLINTIRRIGG